MLENEIRESIDAIEPSIGAKERMYQNIINKAKPAVTPKQHNSHRKPSVSCIRYALPATACLCLLVIGLTYFISGRETSSSETDLLEGNVLSGNPLVEVDSPEAFSELGISLEAPENAADITYTIIGDQIAAMNFTMNGSTFEVRASAQADDFSGLTGTQLDTEVIDQRNNASICKIISEFAAYYKITWTIGEINYCLFGTEDTTREEIIAVYNALVN